MLASISLRRLRFSLQPSYSLLSNSSDDRSPNYNAVLNDLEMVDLTLYEKKALLVNRELNSHGMGKYQWYIFFLCGFGFLIDLLYAQAFALVAPAMQQELGFSDTALGSLFSAFGAGLCAGAFIWGVLVDIIGRQYAFNLTVLITAIFGLCIGAPSNYNSIRFLTAFTGIGVGGNIPIDTTICLEFLPQNRRFLLALLSIFQPLGVVVSSGIAYGFIPTYSCGDGEDGKPLPACNNVASGQPCCTRARNMGWRYLLVTLGAMCLAIFVLRFVFFRFQESPKFLVYRGQDRKAIEVLHYIARFNDRESSITTELFESLIDEDSSVVGDDRISPTLHNESKEIETSLGHKVMTEFSRFKILFSTAAMGRLSILIWITYIFDYWGFSIAGSLLPKILLKKNSTIHVSVSETYRNFIIIYLCGIPGVLLGAAMYGVPIMGRKWAMVVSSALMGVSLFLFATVNTKESNVALNALEYFFQSIFNAVLYGWTPEAFPASIRGTAAGIASFWGRLFSIIAPLIGAHLLAVGLNAPLYLAGAGSFVCTLAILLIPTSQMEAKRF